MSIGESECGTRVQHNSEVPVTGLLNEAASQAVDSTVMHRKQHGSTPGEPTALSGRNAANEVSGLPKTSAFCGSHYATRRAPAGGHKEESETRQRVGSNVG